MREYFISNKIGNDNNSGSLNSPFQSFNRIRSLSLVPGDKMLFHCGEEFPLAFRSDTGRYQGLTLAVSGDPEYPIIIESYGNGSKPVIKAMYPLAASWIQHSANIWKASSGADKIHRIILDGKESAVASSVAGIDGSRYLWFYDQAGKTLYLYSTANPQAAYASILPVYAGSFLLANSKSFWTIRDIEFCGQGDGVLEIGGVGGNIEIRNVIHKYSSGFSVWVEHWTNPNISNVLIDNSEFDTCLNLINRIVSDGNIYLLAGDMICNRGGGSGWIIRGSKFKNFGHSAISLQQTAATGQPINDWIIETNLFTAPNSPYSRAYEIEGLAGKCQRNIFRKNIISDVCVRSQIGGEDNLIEKNIFDYIRKTETVGRGNVANAICLYAYGSTVCNRNSISRNYFKNISMEAVWMNKWSDINDNIVSRNIFIDCGMDSYHQDIALYAQPGINLSNLVHDNCFWKHGVSKMIDWADVHYAPSEANEKLANFSANKIFPDDIVPGDLGIDDIGGKYG